MDKDKKDNFKQEFTKRLIEFSLEIIKFCQELRKDPNLRIIADQLLRSATSIGANIVEAKASSSKREYLRYFSIALKSSNETKYWLILIRESSDKYKIKSIKCLDESNQISKIIGSAVLTMKGKKKL